MLTPHFNQPDTNLDDGKLPTVPAFMFASPGIRGEQEPELTSLVTPQASTDWLREGLSTSSPPSLIASLVPGNTQKSHQPQLKHLYLALMLLENDGNLIFSNAD